VFENESFVERYGLILIIVEHHIVVKIYRCGYIGTKF